MRRWIPLFVFAALSFGACDDDSPGQYDGMYQMTVAQESDTCDGTGWVDINLPYSYFQLHHESFFGTPIIAFHDCTGETADTCDDAIELVWTFMKEFCFWEQHMTSSSFQDPDICNVSQRRGLIEETETGIAITVTHKSGAVTVTSEDECEPELADTHEDELTCTGQEYYEATLLP